MIALEASLRAETDGIRLQIDGVGRVITCRIHGNPLTVAATLRHLRGILPALRAVIEALSRAGLRVDVFVGPLRVARAGNGVRQNRLARLLDFPAAHLGA